MQTPYGATAGLHHRSTKLALILLAIVALTGSLLGAAAVDVRSRTSLKDRAATIADALPISDIEQLKGDSSDLQLPAYQRLKEQLIHIKGHNGDLKFVYLMGSRNSDVFFFADNVAPTSSDYSAPGDAYPEASPHLHRIFQDKEAFVEGPMRDSYGIWLSGLAPVVDETTGKVVAVAGIDMPGLYFYRQTLLVAIVPILLAAIPFVYLVRQRKVGRKEDEIRRLKTQFISIASHELRSPLNGLLWGIQGMLTDENLNQPQQETLQQMYQSVQSSLATVNEILDASIFERSKEIKLRHDLVELISVFTAVENTLGLSAKERKIKITHDAGWPAHVYCYGDVAALKRAVMNLVANAIAFSFPSGFVSLHYTREGDMHVFSITDHGIGIPKADIPKILEGYFRSENAVRMVGNGTGIGMYVTKAIIEGHGGHLEIQSEEGSGTTVRIKLPLTELTNTIKH